MFKQLIRKALFWDMPEQGTFFGLTLLLLTAWCGFSVFCACIVVHSRIFWFVDDSWMIAVPLIFFSWLILFCLYGAFLVLKGGVNMVRRTPRLWGRLVKMLAGIAALTPFCVLGAFNLLPQRLFYHGDLTDAIIRLASRAAFYLAILGMGYLFRPLVHPAKLLSCLLGWTSGFLVFSTLLFLANPFEERTGYAFNRCPDWLGQDVPYVVPFWDWFDLKGSGCFWFALAGFLLVAVAYYLSWSILAKLSGRSMRTFCGRGIRIQWGIMAGTYVVTLCFALWSNAQYHNAVKELEAHFGHPMTGTELGNIYYEGRTPDPAYWERLDGARKRYHQEYEKTAKNDDYPFVMHLDAVLPKELYEKRREGFMNSLSVSGLLEVFVSPMPPGERDYSIRFLAGMELPELSKCRELARLEHRRCLYAIDSGDFNTAAETIAHLDILCAFLSRESFYIGYLVWRGVGLIRNEMLAKLLASGLPTDNWLEEQANQLLRWEKMVERQEKMVIYSEAVTWLDYFQIIVGKVEKDKREVLGSMNYWLNYKAIRFFFPQGWWFAAKSARDYARAMKATTFDPFPQKAVGCVLVDMFISSLNRGGVKKRGYIASCRVLRGLIAAELQKRRTGNYPDVLEEIPLDPFTSQPLKYRKGTCQIIRHYCKWQPDEESSDDESDESSAKDEPGEEVSDEEADDTISEPEGSWVFEPKEETVEAVQIWSVGPDGIDDGGDSIKRTQDADYERTDDIRFFIPIR